MRKPLAGPQRVLSAINRILFIHDPSLPSQQLNNVFSSFQSQHMRLLVLHVHFRAYGRPQHDTLWLDGRAVPDLKQIQNAVPSMAQQPPVGDHAPGTHWQARGRDPLRSPLRNPLQNPLPHLVKSLGDTI